MKSQNRVTFTYITIIITLCYIDITEILYQFTEDVS